MVGIFPVPMDHIELPRAKVIAVCGIDTDSVLATTASLIICKEFKHHVEAGSVEFRIACQDKHAVETQLSKAFWRPNVLTENPDEALMDADLVVLAADSVASVRRNQVSFQAVKISIQRKASPDVRVVSYGLPVHEERAFQYLFPAWNVKPVPTNDFAAVTTILCPLSDGIEHARPDEDGRQFVLESHEKSCESGDTLEHDHTMEVDDGSGSTDDYVPPESMDTLLPLLESEIHWPPCESLPTSTLQAAAGDKAQYHLPPSCAGEDYASVELFLLSDQPEDPSGHETPSPHAQVSHFVVDNEYCCSETESGLRTAAMDEVRPEPLMPIQDAQQNIILPPAQPSLCSQPTPPKVVDDPQETTVKVAAQERKDELAKIATLRNTLRKRGQRANLKRRAEAGDQEARKKQADINEKQKRQLRRRRFRNQLLARGKCGMEWFEPLYDACIELAPAYGQTVHDLFSYICSQLGELRRHGSVDVILISKYHEENIQRHLSFQRNSDLSLVKVFDTLLSLAGDEATNVLDRIKLVHKVTEKYAKLIQSNSGG